MSKHEAARYEPSRRIAQRPLEEAPCRLMLDKAAVMQKNDILGKPPRLAYVVGYNNYFDAAVRGIDEDALNGERRRGIEACSRLIEKKHFWIEA